MISPNGVVSDNAVAATLAIEALRRLERDINHGLLDLEGLFDVFSDEHRYNYQRHAFIDAAIGHVRKELSPCDDRTLTLADIHFAHDCIELGMKSVIPVALVPEDWPYGWPLQEKRRNRRPLEQAVLAFIDGFS